MSELTPQARDLLEHARSGQMRTSAGARARVRAAVDAAVASPALPSVSKPALHALRRKPWLSVVSLAAIGGAVAWLAWHAPPPPLASEPSATRIPADPPAVALPAPSPDGSQLSEELSLLAAAESALRASDHERALATLRVHVERFPHGQLRQEREGLRLIALCSLKREPQDAVQRYLRAAPRSVLASRVRQACMGDAR